MEYCKHQFKPSGKRVVDFISRRVFTCWKCGAEWLLDEEDYDDYGLR